MSDLRYPVGKFKWTDPQTEEHAASDRRVYIDVLAALPAKLRNAVQDLRPEQLDTPYRPEGWTVRQLVHHVPDSHLNAYIRFKLALTEEQPAIKPYNEAEWAKLEDARTTPIETSLTLLDCVHDRWVRVLNSMSDADFSRKLNHPENGILTLDQMLALYEWHGRHHVAHVTNLRQRSGW
jgi:uncharacterized damage-inducible protein DinB